MDLFQLKEFIWDWILPLICLLGLGANAINIRVFSLQRINSKNRLHTYLHIDSIVEFVYLLICLIHFILRRSSYKNTFYIVVYEKYLYNYLASSLAFFMLFTKLFISLKRLLIACNQRVRFRMVKLKSLLACFFFLSFLFDISFLSGVSVAEISQTPSNSSSPLNTSKNGPRYFLSYQKSKESLTNRAFFYFSSGFRGLFAPILLLLVNIFFLKKLTKKLNNINEIFNDPSQKQRLGTKGIKFIGNNLDKASSNIRRNIIKMIIGMNFLFIVGNFTTFVTRILAVTLSHLSLITCVSSIFSNTLLYLSHGLSLFIYYNYDPIYKDSFSCIIKGLKKNPRITHL